MDLGRIHVARRFASPPLGGLLVELFSWFQQRFRPHVPPLCDDKYRSGSYRFVERQKHHLAFRLKNSVAVSWRDLANSCGWPSNGLIFIAVR